jgi:dTDP-glucose 4,6-dehydratase
MRFNGKTVFVTGGAGFVGSAVVRDLLNGTNACVVNIDKLTYAANISSISQLCSHNRYAFARADIRNARRLKALFDRHQPDAILNLAAETHVDRSIDDPGEFIQTNVVGTFTLLQESLRYWRSLAATRRNAFRLIHVSTDEVYGDLPAGSLSTENSPYSPRSPYSASKAASDHLVHAWRETYGLPTIVTNCSNNYGPFHFPEKLIPHIIIKGLMEEPLPVYGDGLNVRDWLYVEDHAKALALVLERGCVGETYNIGSRNDRTNLHVVETICALLDQMAPSLHGPRKRLITFVEDRPGHDRRYGVDASKIERELGWRAQETFETGLAKTVRWYLENRAWWQSIIERGYDTKRIGLADSLSGLELEQPAKILERPGTRRRELAIKAVPVQ